MEENKLTENLEPIPKKKFKLWKVLIIFAVIIGVLSSCGDDEEKKDTSLDKETTTTNAAISEPIFEPKETITCTDNQITINADIDCPDGAIMQVTLMNSDFTEVYNDKPVVKNKKITSTFDLTNSDVKMYVGAIAFQFNADSIKQPDNVTSIYGKNGEKLTGDNLTESETDGNVVKMGMYSFEVPYPSEQEVTALRDKIFNEYSNNVINSIDGITSVKKESGSIYSISVTNSWYLLTEEEKQYLAEELLKSVSEVSDSIYGIKTITLSIYDESHNEVATSKILGGMKIKK